MARDDASVDLAGERERYVLHQRQVLRDHVRGNTFGHRFADELDGQPRIICPESCGQDIGAARRRHQGGDRYRHTRDLTQYNLDFADFDPIAADFDSVIAASHELQDSVWPISGQIAGAIPGPAVVLNKPLGGEIRTSAVAPGEAASGDPQFTGDPIGAIGALIVDHPAGIVGKRCTEWQRRQLRWECVDVADLENGVVDGGFGGATQAGEAQRGSLGPKAANHLGPHPVTAGGDYPHRRQAASTYLTQHLQPARHEVQHRDFVRVDESGPGIGIAPLRLVDHHDRSTGPQGDEDVHHRDVALQRGQRQATIRRADLEMPGDELDGVHRGVVGYLYTLGLPGGARGEQHVGQRGGIGCRDVNLSVGGRAGQHISDRQRRHRQRESLAATHQGQLHLTGQQNTFRAVRGLVDADRQIDPTGRQNPQQRGHLFSGFGTHHRNGVTLANPVRAQG